MAATESRGTALQVSSAVVHGFVRFLEADGAREAILPLLSDSARRILESPPPPGAMVPAGALGEAIAVLLQAGGPSKLAQYGAFSAREIVGPMLRPWLERLCAGRPESMLGRLAEVLSPVLQGARTAWEPRGERSGTLVIAYDDAAPAWPTYVVWQGAVAEHLAECGVRAEVGAPEIDPDNTSARYAVRW